MLLSASPLQRAGHRFPRKKSMDASITERITTTLLELHKLLPSMRFGQLVLTVAQAANGPTIEATYDVTDEDFLKAAEVLLRRRRQEQRPAPGSHVKRAG
jgi:hypothetical protein